MSLLKTLINNSGVSSKMLEGYSDEESILIYREVEKGYKLVDILSKINSVKISKELVNTKLFSDFEKLIKMSKMSNDFKNYNKTIKTCQKLLEPYNHVDFVDFKNIQIKLKPSKFCDLVVYILHILKRVEHRYEIFKILRQSSKVESDNIPIRKLLESQKEITFNDINSIYINGISVSHNELIYYLVKENSLV